MTLLRKGMESASCVPLVIQTWTSFLVASCNLRNLSKHMYFSLAIPDQLDYPSTVVGSFHVLYSYTSDNDKSIVFYIIYIIFIIVTLISVGDLLHWYPLGICYSNNLRFDSETMVCIYYLYVWQIARQALQHWIDDW